MTQQTQRTAAKRRRGQPALAAFLSPPTTDERRHTPTMLAEWRFLAERFEEAHSVYNEAQEELAGATDPEDRRRLELKAALALEFMDVVDIALNRQPVPVAVENPMAAVRRVLEERAAPRAVLALEEALKEFIAQGWDVHQLSPALKWQARVAMFPLTIVISEEQERAFNDDLDNLLRSYEFEDLLRAAGPHVTACAVLAAMRDQDIRTVQENLRKAKNIANRFGNTFKVD